MMKFRSIALILPVFLLAVSSCSWEPFNPQPPDETSILNHWIWEEMNTFYLWEEYLPNLDPDKQADPEAYFYNLLYDGDKFSRIFDNADELLASIDGVEIATGVSAQPVLYNQTDVVSFVEYVSPDTPAADSGIKRGDMIIAIDGIPLNKDNYFSLYYQTSATLEFASWNGSDFIPNGRKVTLVAEQLKLNPVVYSDIIIYQGKKIGYLVYTQFTSGPSDEWLYEVDEILGEFKAAGISDLVVDLRYNPGGLASLSAYLASSLGPASLAGDHEIFYSRVWNEGYEYFWKEFDKDGDGKPDGENSPALVTRFPESEVNLDLSRVYFLTTGGTASASELLMTGLYPYMDVVQIGSTTVGKCYASIPVEDNVNPKRHNWAMLPIVFKYANADGFTDFDAGIDPDFEVEDNLLLAEPFGSLEDPLLAKAIEEITGLNPSRKSALTNLPSYIKLRVPGKSRVDELIIFPDDFSGPLY